MTVICDFPLANCSGRAIIATLQRMQHSKHGEFTIELRAFSETYQLTVIARRGGKTATLALGLKSSPKPLLIHPTVVYKDLSLISDLSGFTTNARRGWQDILKQAAQAFVEQFKELYRRG